MMFISQGAISPPIASFDEQLRYPTRCRKQAVTTKRQPRTHSIGGFFLFPKANLAIATKRPKANTQNCRIRHRNISMSLSPTFSLLLPDGRVLRTNLTPVDVEQILSRAKWSAISGSYADRSAPVESYTNQKLESPIPLKSPGYGGSLDLRYHAIAADAVAAYIADTQRDLPLAPLLLVPASGTSTEQAYEQLSRLVSLFLCVGIADIIDGQAELGAYLKSMVGAAAQQVVDHTGTVSPSARSNRSVSAVIAAVAAADDFTRRGELASGPPSYLDGVLGVIRTWRGHQRESARRARLGGISNSIRQPPAAGVVASPHHVSVGAVPLPPLEGARPVVVPAPAAVDFSARGFPAASRVAREREAAARKQLAVENSKLQGDVARQAAIIAALNASVVEHETTAARLAEANAKAEAAVEQFAQVRAELEYKVTQLTEANGALAAAAVQHEGCGTKLEQLTEVNAKLQEDTVQLAEANAELADRSWKLTEANAKLEADAAQLAEASAALDGSKNAEREAALAAMQTQHRAELAQAEAALTDLKTRRETDRAEAEAALVELKVSHETALAEATTKGRAMQARAELADSERDDLRQKLTSLTAEVASSKAAAVTAAARCEQHEREHALIVAATRAHACTAMNAHENLTAEFERAMLAATDVFVAAVVAAGAPAAPVAAAPATAGASERLLVEEAEARADEIMSFYGSFRKRLVRLATTAAEEGAAKRAVAQAGAARQERQISAQTEQIAELLRRLTPAAAAGAASAAAPAVVGAASAAPAAGAAATTASVAAAAASATPAAAAPQSAAAAAPAVGLAAGGAVGGPAAAAPPVVAPAASAAAGAAAVASAAAPAAGAAVTTPAAVPVAAPVAALVAAPAVASAAGAPVVAPVAGAAAVGAPAVAPVASAVAAGAPAAAPAAGGGGAAARVAGAHARPVVVNSCTFCKKVAYGMACPRNCGGWWCPKPACKTRCAADASRCPNCSTPYDQDDE
jgi:hypothetical protein